MHSLVYFSFWSVVASLVGTWMLSVEWVKPADWKWWTGLFVTVLFGVCGQVCLRPGGGLVGRIVLTPSFQALMTIGLQRETASRGSIGFYTQVSVYSNYRTERLLCKVQYDQILSSSPQVIYSTMFERILFHNSPSILSIIGTGIIISSASYVVVGY